MEVGVGPGLTLNFFLWKIIQNSPNPVSTDILV